MLFGDEYVVLDELGDVWTLLVRITSCKFTEKSKKLTRQCFNLVGMEPEALVSFNCKHWLGIVSRLQGDSYEHHAANTAVSTSSSIARVCNAIIAEGKTQF